MTSSTKTVRTITPGVARRIAITRQRLAGDRPLPAEDGLFEVSRDLGCLQLDPISSVERSHLLVLFSRVGPFDRKQLDILLWDQRRLFEYWAHCASLVLTEDYPVHHLMMRTYLDGGATWQARVRSWVAENDALRRHILDVIRDNGPTASRQFEDRSPVPWQSMGGWTSGRNVSRMLDFLWWEGTVMVAGRSGGQKLWDLSERCLPSWTPREELSEHEVVYRAAQHSLRALGVGRPQHIQNHFIRGRYPCLRGVLAELERAGRIVQVAIADGAQAWPGPWYVHAEDLALLDQLERGEWEPRTTLLSPFDNLICDRARTELLFDFHFRIEIYVPKEQREYGYYVLPILHGDRLIGRIDPTMDRKRKCLAINNVYLEAGVEADGETVRAVWGAIEELGVFLGAGDITYRGEVPAGWETLRT